MFTIMRSTLILFDFKGEINFLANQKLNIQNLFRFKFF